MNNQPIQLLTADRRIVVEEALIPLDFEDAIGDSVKIQTIFVADRLIRHETSELSDAVSRWLRSFVGNRNKVYRAIEKYLGMLGINYRIVSLRGYSQGEWTDVVLFSEDGQISDALVEGVEAWWRGDVFDVLIQNRKVFTSEDGETIERWDTDEVIGGYIGEPDEILEQAVKEFGN